MVLTMYGTTFDMDVDFVGIVQTCNCANQQVSAHNIWETTWPDNIALSLLRLLAPLSLFCLSRLS
jgi:hypothetical protein